MFGAQLKPERIIQNSSLCDILKIYKLIKKREKITVKITTGTPLKFTLKN